ncbi:MAG: hypothetical protein K6G61_01020 [Solobacterium sp.]|nr:hypothetical protein [Solobacterium sp.]
MHKAKWKADGSGLKLRGAVLYAYVSETDYTMAMLVEDLLEAGIEIEKIEYEEDADVGMKYYGGEVSPDQFSREYDWIRTKGMGGMVYHASCIWKGIPFRTGMADDEYGRSCNTITVLTNADNFDIKELVRILGK